MEKENDSQKSKFIIYSTNDGKIHIDVKFENENVWLTQKSMAELFEVTVSTIQEHLSNIFASNELLKSSVIRKFLITAQDSKQYSTQFYSLEAIIAVGYRVNSEKATKFRIWATDILKNYVLKGFTIDKERFIHGSRFDTRYFNELLEEIREIRASERMAYQKITDIYSTSVDYSPTTVEAERFFAEVQNKLHFAITGKTAAEIIKNRVNSKNPNMGLTSWRKSPNGKILPSNIIIAKNYLTKEELNKLNLIVTMYIDFAEFQASKGELMTMKDWSNRLNEFLKVNREEVLPNNGNITHEEAQKIAEQEYEKYRIIQDGKFISDFDKISQKILKKLK